VLPSPQPPEMHPITRFAHFWYDFIVGDDWTIALAVAGALAVTYAVAHSGAKAIWFLLPAVIVGVLAASLWREARRKT